MRDRLYGREAATDFEHVIGLEPRSARGISQALAAPMRHCERGSSAVLRLARWCGELPGIAHGVLFRRCGTHSRLHG